MHVIVILLGVSLSLAILFLSAFIWSVRKGQFDDAVTPALRILTEEDEPRISEPSGDNANKDPS